MTQPATEQPPAEPKADGSQQQQINDIRAEQQRQGTAIDRILGILDKPGDPSPPSQPEARPEADMVEQMKTAVRAVNAEAAASRPEPKPEVPPREPGKKRDRMQRVLFGKLEKP